MNKSDREVYLKVLKRWTVTIQENQITLTLNLKYNFLLCNYERRFQNGTTSK